ncbi:archease [Patescibacteria group bacterium]|nr:archease [Patescibacteria group bacterium]MBU1035020.1 archease [Patescibacteria group bacterium]MBU1629536.1 archease [Patescibacteria group bacterium]MBU1907680.1 archease [Patescibacteria group bacterium]
MQKYEIIPHMADLRIRALGSTRAGLLIAVVKGMSAAIHPTFADNAEERERPFSIGAPDFNGLLDELMKTALGFSEKNGEVYTDVRFDLVTDKEARGVLIGKSALKMEAPVKKASVQEVSMEKNPEGMWEATVVLHPESA